MSTIQKITQNIRVSAKRIIQTAIADVMLIIPDRSGPPNIAVTWTIGDKDQLQLLFTPEGMESTGLLPLSMLSCRDFSLLVQYIERFYLIWNEHGAPSDYQPTVASTPERKSKKQRASGRPAIEVALADPDNTYNMAAGTYQRGMDDIARFIARECDITGDASGVSTPGLLKAIRS